MEKLSKESSQIEMILSDSSLYEPDNKDKLKAHLLAQAKMKKELEQLDNDWLQACEERDSP
jgi:ATP-binding cassette subfamily F protein 3